MDVNKPRNPGSSIAKRFSKRHARAPLAKHCHPLTLLLHPILNQAQHLPICTQQEQASALADQADGQLHSQFKIWQVGKVWGIVQDRESYLNVQDMQIEKTKWQSWQSLKI